ncbi:MAG: SIS domain-containing protein [Myxococcales bacterium]|nr:SIS domain-containing protein [Myxococcales bacterium]
MNSWMAQEIGDTPARLRELAPRWAVACAEARHVVADRPQRVLVGRGSSGNACTFYSYLWAMTSGRGAAEFRPWVATQPDPGGEWRDAAALVLSVSGESTDIVHAASWLADRGAKIVAVTNSGPEDTTLARRASAHIDLGVGPELAVPATKTFLAQLCVAAGLCGYPLDEALSSAADCIDTLLAGSQISRLVDRLAEVRQIVWVARGPALAVALDAALKLQESAGVLSQGYSAAELHHGPIGALDECDVVFLLNDADEPSQSLQATTTVLLARGIPFAVLGDERAAKRFPLFPLPLPAERWARSLVFASASQQIALELAQRLGRNPDAPPGLSKVTHTL